MMISLKLFLYDIEYSFKFVGMVLYVRFSINKSIHMVVKFSPTEQMVVNIVNMLNNVTSDLSCLIIS